MKDLFRFVWRGAVGGAIVPILFLTYYLIAVFGAQLFWYFLIIAIFLAIPGAIVGVVLWICALVLERLGFVVRVTIGAALNSFLALGWSLLSGSIFYDPADFRRLVFSSTYYLLIGGLAGWLCPEAMIYRREPEPPYRERVQQYEAAQAEHELRRSKRLKEGQEDRHSIHVSRTI